MTSNHSIIREVWNYNVSEEIDMIYKIFPFTPFVSFDTEFPGTIYKPDVPNYCLSSLPPETNYSYMKANVDALKLIQIGLTLSTSPNPLSGSVRSFVWQFNIKDFDIDSDVHNSDSIALLKNQGIDFARNRVDGIDSGLLVSMLTDCGVLGSKIPRVWITFHGAYDFGFIVKILTGSPLPSDPIMFMVLVRQIFGESVFDLKHVMKSFNGLYGGLDRLATTLQVERRPGTQSHQAGSDSLLIMEVFYKLRQDYLDKLPLCKINGFKNIIHGLELSLIRAYQPQPQFQPHYILIPYY
ncbi:probable CCR4-associated factor 1 homolog 11 [Impatiens glandulifera]|uniref:probable CCR4-associated factor 1 homolog 11 n=1 Tax=Impatiens glandulifera TaxID=253017 RepID=UPI001FB0E5E6|nr:probable CCR4-associated factor 1 homolog 11 [Impatiens glandulifera]